jgi:hypothetical protein
MNDWDRNNLQFILSLTPEQFDEWYSSISQDDVEYAIEIIRQARSETVVKMAEIFDEVPDLSLARSVLANFTLKGNLK